MFNEILPTKNIPKTWWFTIIHYKHTTYFYSTTMFLLFKCIVNLLYFRFLYRWLFLFVCLFHNIPKNSQLKWEWKNNTYVFTKWKTPIMKPANFYAFGICKNMFFMSLYVLCSIALFSVYKLHKLYRSIILMTLFYCFKIMSFSIFSVVYICQGWWTLNI